MLAVTANWLLTDGSLARPHEPSAGAWLHTIRRAVIRAGFQRDGRYEPVESVSLVLAGDTFDWLLSAAWGGRDRPWDGSHRSGAVKGQIVIASLRASRRLLGGLLRWTRIGIPVPGVDARGRPSARSIVYAPVRMALLSGDRDGWLSAGRVSAARAKGPLRMWFGESWSDGDLTIRHGHEWDPSTHAFGGTFAAGRRLPSLAESLAVDLVVPFAIAIKAETRVWPWARAKLATIAAAGPVAMPRVVANLADRPDKPPSAGRLIRAEWQRCVRAWLKRARHEPPQCAVEHDAVEALAEWLEGGVEAGERSVPSAVGRLAIPRGPAAPAGTMLGHAGLSAGQGADHGPLLTVVRPVRSTEPLGPGIPMSPIVTIGAVGGGGIVEAA